MVLPTINLSEMEEYISMYRLDIEIRGEIEGRRIIRASKSVKTLAFAQSVLYPPAYWASPFLSVHSIVSIYGLS